MKVNINGAITIPKSYRKQISDKRRFAQIHEMKPDAGGLTLKFCENGIPMGEHGLVTIPRYVRVMMKIESEMLIEDVEFKKQSSILICKVIYKKD